jgi:hypothetical protein
MGSSEFILHAPFVEAVVLSSARESGHWRANRYGGKNRDAKRIPPGERATRIFSDPRYPSCEAVAKPDGGSATIECLADQVSGVATLPFSVTADKRSRYSGVQ